MSETMLDETVVISEAGMSAQAPHAVRIEGDLDFEVAPAMRDRLFRMLDHGHCHLVLDLNECPYVDSSGLLAIVAATYRARSLGGSLRLVKPPLVLVRMLQLNHLGEILNVPAQEPPSPRHRLLDTGVGRWETRRLETPAVPQACALARRAVLRAAAGTPFTEEGLADLELAVGEAFSNAVRHGSPRAEQDRVTVRTLRGSLAFVVEVSDRGLGFDRAQVVLPGPDEIREGGMGIFYMESLMDHVEFESRPCGTTVRLLKLYPQGDGSSVSTA